MKILFISVDGMTDPLGQSQVIPYMEGLTIMGHDIIILSCEKPDRLAVNEKIIARRLNEHHIRWYHTPYLTQLPGISKFRTLLKLKRMAAKLARSEKPDLVHCRSYIPAIVGDHLRKSCGVPFIFDMRGFWADERIDGGIWKLQNPFYRFLFRYFKRKEKSLLQHAAAVVTLTQASIPWIEQWKGASGMKNQVVIIPCATDFDHFQLVKPDIRNSYREKLTIPENAMVISCLGSLGTWYMLPEILDFFKALLEQIPGVFLLFITMDDPSLILKLLPEKQIPESSIRIVAASRNEVPAFLSVSDWGISFIKPAFSKQASFPTKTAEYMALGIPMICNPIGDLAEMIEETGGGILNKEFKKATYIQTIRQMLTFAYYPASIREKAFEKLNLGSAVKKYHDLYLKLAR